MYYHYPSFSEFSSLMDEYRKERKEPAMSQLRKMFIFGTVCFGIAVLEDVIYEAEMERQFRKRFRTVIKQDKKGKWKYEYHER